MSNIVIKNVIEICGDFEEVNEVKRSLHKFKSSKRLFDFERIIPIARQVNARVPMTKYTEYCLNLYMLTKNVNREKFYKTMKFVGYTREIPYNFQLMSTRDFEGIKNDKKTFNKMINDAESFIEKVKSKSIFNDYLVREAYWSTGSNATEIFIKDNRITFKTFDKMPMAIVEKFSLLYPNVKIYYKAIIKKQDKQLINSYIFSNGKKEVRCEEMDNDVNLTKLISENVLI